MPNVAAVVPVFKQPQYLAEAVSSALAQSGATTRVVIVDDGCPYPATHAVARALEAAHPGRVLAVRQPNRGLSAARNAGVDRALHQWPDTDYVLFLDADNRLSPDTIERFLTAFEAEPTAGWAYPALETFGTEYFVWSAPDRYSAIRQLFDNQCDAASLVARPVIDAGVRFDESMRRGYEDWDFYVRATLAGFRGVNAGLVGFRYRRRSESLLSTAIDRHAEIMAHMKESHRRVLRGDTLLRLEDHDLPRFAWCDPFRGSWVRATTVGSLQRREAVDGPEGTEAMVLVAGRVVLEHLGQLLPGLLLRAQAALRHHPLYGVSIRSSADGATRLEASDGLGPLHLLVGPWHRLDHPPSVAHLVEHQVGCYEELTLGAPFASSSTRLAALGSDVLRVVDPPAADETDSLEPAPASLDALARWSRAYVAEQRPQGRHREWALQHHVHDLDTVLPVDPADDPARTIAFAVPWLRLGGVDHCVTQLARALRRVRPDWPLDLVVTEVSDLAGEAAALELFRSVTFVAGLPDPERRLAYAAAVAPADVAVNAHSGVAFNSIPEVRKLAYPPVHVAYSHVLDLDEAGLPAGWPEVAAQLDPGIDRHLVISERMRRYLVNQGVPDDKITIGRNAAVAAATSLEAALEAARARAADVADGRPLRLLFAGRLDVQKGVARLQLLAERLGSLRPAVEMTVLGATVLRGEQVKFPPWVQQRPPETDVRRLARAFAAHDVLLLLSRWEGVPLALLDAMSHGMVPVATRVGSVDELVSETDGVLLDPDATDEAIADAAFDAVESLLQEPVHLASLGSAGARRAWSYRWDDVAQILIEIAEGR